MKIEATEVVSQFLTAVKALDLEKVGSLLDASVQWHQPGSSEISGLKTPQGEVFAMVGKMFELSGNTLKLESFDELTVNGSRIACQLHWTAEKSSGMRLNVSNIDIYTVNGGKISKVEVFSSDQTQEDIFWKR